MILTEIEKEMFKKEWKTITDRIKNGARKRQISLSNMILVPTENGKPCGKI
jgi:hypothetical protein